MIDEYILITTKGEYELVEIDRDNFLNKCYELLNCELIEICVPNFPKHDTPIRFVVDDCGKLGDQEPNFLATALYNLPDILFGNVLVGKVGLNQYGEMDLVGLEYYESDEMKFILEKARDNLKRHGMI